MLEWLVFGTSCAINWNKSYLCSFEAIEKRNFDKYGSNLGYIKLAHDTIQWPLAFMDNDKH